MSLNSELQYYRPGTPPLVTGPDVAAFIEKLEGTGAIDGKGLWLNVKFGDQIDRDDKPSGWIEWKRDVGKM